MVFIVIIVVLFLADIGVKCYIDKTMDIKDEKLILNKKIKITKYRNYGAAMNYLKDKRKTLITISSVLMLIISILFLLILPKRRNYIIKLAYSFLLAGGSSNLYERIAKGYVTDYFCFMGNAPVIIKKLVFNMADMFIFIGAFLSLLAKDPLTNI